MRNNIFLNREQLSVALQNPSSWTLIAVNLGLVLAVVLWKWSIFDIVFLYWVENLVVGAINVLKMLFSTPGEAKLSLHKRTREARTATTQAKPSPYRADATTKWTRLVANWGTKLFLIPFFIIHYGIFCYGHGVFVFSLFGDATLSAAQADGQAVMGMLSSNMKLAIALLAASHLFSFFRNYLLGGEHRQTNPAALMMRPYGRIVVLHITIILGGILTMTLGDPLGLLMVLMVLKTWVDLRMHQAERNKYSGIY